MTIIDDSYDAAVAAAADAARGDSLLIQDSAWPGYEVIPQYIVDGYSTLFREIDAEPDLVVVPMGVGSIAQAAVTHYRSGPVTPSVLGVEPASAACVIASLQAGELVTVPTDETVMAGLNCGTPSSLAWPVLRAGLDAAVTVEESEAPARSRRPRSGRHLFRPEWSRDAGRPARGTRPVAVECHQHDHLDQYGGRLVIDYRIRFPVDDSALSGLHALAFGSPVEVQPWAARLDRHALTWVGAFSNDLLVGFVQVCWDGGAHAFVLDTAVHPEYGRQGIGKRLVGAAAAEAKTAGCEWLHVDYEPHLADFYVKACGFSPTEAALLKLR